MTDHSKFEQLFLTIAIITTLTRPYDLHVWEVEARSAAKRKVEKEDTEPEQVPIHSYGMGDT